MDGADSSDDVVLRGGPGEVLVVVVDPPGGLAVLEADVVVEAAPAGEDPPDNDNAADNSLVHWKIELNHKGAIYLQHTEGDSVMRWRKLLLSALAGSIAVCPALLSMLGQPNFEITRLIDTPLCPQICVHV